MKVAKKNLELSESVTATFKDGHQETFETLEEASASTGLSVESIKTRCSKPGCGSKSKDGITFVWADDYTRRAKQAKRSKQKGNHFELEVTNKLKEIGYEGCVSARSQDKRADANKIDIVDMNGELPVNVQCKYTANTPSYFTIRDACTDKSKPFALFWKKATSDGSQSPGTVVVIPADYFYKLIAR